MLFTAAVAFSVSTLTDGLGCVRMLLLECDRFGCCRDAQRPLLPPPGRFVFERMPGIGYDEVAMHPSAGP